MMRRLTRLVNLVDRVQVHHNLLHECHPAADFKSLIQRIRAVVASSQQMPTRLRQGFSYARSRSFWRFERESYLARIAVETAASSIFHFLATVGLSVTKTLSLSTTPTASMGRIFNPSAFILISLITSASASIIVLSNVSPGTKTGKGAYHSVPGAIFGRLATLSHLLNSFDDDREHLRRHCLPNVRFLLCRLVIWKHGGPFTRPVAPPAVIRHPSRFESAIVVQQLYDVAFRHLSPPRRLCLESLAFAQKVSQSAASTVKVMPRPL